MGMSVASSVFADVTPVPNSVVPKKIEGVRPRNVVFILSDDHRYDAMPLSRLRCVHQAEHQFSLVFIPFVIG